MSWRNFDAATLEREYSPSSCIGGNYQPYIRAYAERSTQARAAVHGRLDLAYGAKSTQRLDLFVPPHPHGVALPPLLVFIHGGYWQELSKNESSFAAGLCVEQGFAFAALDYTLAPHAALEQIVSECRTAVGWLHGRASELGFDARRIVVSGSSAGAHLAAMVALPSPQGSGLRHPAAGCVRGAVLVSGVYELEPLVGTSINDALGLNPESARAASPALHPLHGFPRSVVCWGEVETSEFKRQGRDFAAQLGRAGSACEAFEVPARNHFDVILDLVESSTTLGRTVAALLRAG